MKVIPKTVVIVFFFLLAFSQPASGMLDPGEGCEYWVAPPPVGNDQNPGSVDHPWASLQHANNNVLDNDCIVWFFPGDYVNKSRLNRRFMTQTIFKSLIPYQAVLKGDDSVLSISGAKNVVIEGFNIHHLGPQASPLLVAIDGSDKGWSEFITLRNNIIHDSFNNDLLKVYNLARFITIEDNIFYNQGPPEEHMDINSVTDVVVQDNIFFNDYEASGRINENQSKQFIVIKDSNGDVDGLVGSQRIAVRRNILLNWEGQDDETFIQVGLDGKPYYEALDVHIEDNLLIGNSSNQVGAAFGVRGAKDVYFVNNTIVGNLPSSAYAFRVTISDQNPKNQNIYFKNNIWADYTGTMGEGLVDGSAEFSHGDPVDTINLVLDNNLYWNAGETIPGGDIVSPIPDDSHRIIADPQLAVNQNNVTLPFWNGNTFLSGNKTIRSEFYRLATHYGMLPVSSPAKDKADPVFAPSVDIRGYPRQGLPDLGAYEYRIEFRDYLPVIKR